MGFTLIELVTIVGIISLLLIVVSLNFSTWRANARLKSTARDVASQMQLARVEAARLNTSILIQITTGGPGIGKSVVFVDDGSGGGTAGNQNPEPGEIIKQLTMPQTVILNSSTPTVFQYTNRGFPVLGGGGSVSLTNGEKTYNVTVATAGGVRLKGPV
jgi:Tfp pilus assembly protein FimT